MLSWNSENKNGKGHSIVSPQSSKFIKHTYASAITMTCLIPRSEVIISINRKIFNYIFNFFKLNCILKPYHILNEVPLVVIKCLLVNYAVYI